MGAARAGAWLCLLPLMLAGCAAPAPAPSPPEIARQAPDAAAERSRRCRLRERLGLIGRAAHEIDAGRLPDPVRIYARGDRVTQDYVPERLNVVLDRDRARVVSVHCG